MDTPTCGARTRSGEPCKRTAGWGTYHPGAGRCKFHGGATPIKHGLRSKLAKGNGFVDKLRRDDEERVVRITVGGLYDFLAVHLEAQHQAPLRFIRPEDREQASAEMHEAVERVEPQAIDALRRREASGDAAHGARRNRGSS